MKENKLTIEINRPIAEVFEFTINPDNTHLWIDFIAKEEVNNRPVQLGTKYSNTNKNGNVNSYVVSQFEENNIFELQNLNADFMVRYIYTPIGDNQMNLEYFERVNEGELSDPFPQSALDKLKKILEEK
jgi:hypothetical protein